MRLGVLNLRTLRLEAVREIWKKLPLALLTKNPFRTPFLSPFRIIILLSSFSLLAMSSLLGMLSYFF